MSCAGKEKQRAKRQQATRTTHYTGHRATLEGLFQALENMVCPSSQCSHNSEDSSNHGSPAKWKILDHAMGFLLEKEAYLSKLLALKEVHLNDDGGPKSLEDVRDEYRRLYSKDFLHIRRHSRRARVPDVDEGDENVKSTDEETDEPLLSQSSESSVPNIQEFEGYLFFYSETLELLLRSGVLAPDQTALSVVSEAISGLWSSLPPERRAEAQQHALDQRSWESQSETNDLHLISLNPSYGLQEDLLQDAYDVVQSDLDAASVNSSESQGAYFDFLRRIKGFKLALPSRKDKQFTHRPSALLTITSRPSVLQSCDYEKLRQIYKDISAFIENHMAEEQELPQDLSQADEYEEHLLRCSESFDEDF